MLCRHKIELSIPTASLPDALIPRAVLADSQQAERLLKHAQAQADTLLRQAQEKSEQWLEQAQAEFWQRANRQLQRWELERQAICERLEQIATSVTNQALSNLLEQTPPAERLSALLKKMLNTQVPAIAANLVCHPQDHLQVEHWLTLHSDAPWSLRLDNSLTAQTLILETDEGSFHIEWRSTVDSLLLLEPVAGGR
ncbi:type III secretion system stator protein SctL [Pseudomonas sp. MWU13-2517]|uniref:type III secretion system stator protein SctL n=1 Tax=Pseudomonas sp. MWU13-2517 TaxID=2929055 RepID=UPI00200E2D27|nr:type III secretion system stator protein SctL [Pseudomonas sp. MWU13-2517]